MELLDASLILLLNDERWRRTRCQFLAIPRCSRGRRCWLISGRGKLSVSRRSLCSCVISKNSLLLLFRAIRINALLPQFAIPSIFTAGRFALKLSYNRWFVSFPTVHLLLLLLLHIAPVGIRGRVIDGARCGLWCI